MQLKMFQFYTPLHCKLLFTPNAQLRSRLGLHPNWLSFDIHLLNLGDWAVILRRLGSEAWHSYRKHADHFINACAYGSKSFISLCIYAMWMYFLHKLYVAFVTEGHMVE